MLRLLSNMLCAIYFASPDDGSGGGDHSTGTGAGDQTGDQDAQEKGKDGKDHTSGTDNRTREEILAELLKSEEDRKHLLKVHDEMKKKAEKQAKAEAEAKKKALEEQGKYKELYETDHNELEKLKTRATTLETALQAYYNEEAKDLPDNIKQLITETDPVETKLATLTKFKAAGILDSKSKGDGSPPAGGKEKATLLDLFKNKS
jgi:ribonucleoside-triphosphate reductase